MASLAAASTWPLAYAVGLRLGNPPAGASIVVLNGLENYLAAILALLPSLVLRRLGAAVQKAREMGSYELVERLDRGGMGEVWRARHRMLARPAAIKLIRPDRLGLAHGQAADNIVLRFEREAQATAALHSPHTVELYDFGVTREGTFYYVMEILDGLDLESLVRRFGPVPAERAAHLLVQACDSLDDAHFAGLIHRDIKPANLYACRRGRRYDFLKVLDFGLVKSSWADASSDPALSRESAITGTPAYLAPEVVLGERAIDGRVDIYGLGCVAYWLVSGQRVFEGATSMELVLHHVQTAPVPPSQRGGSRGAAGAGRPDPRLPREGPGAPAGQRRRARPAAGSDRAPRALDAGESARVVGRARAAGGGGRALTGSTRSRTGTRRERAARRRRAAAARASAGDRAGLPAGWPDVWAAAPARAGGPRAAA